MQATVDGRVVAQSDDVIECKGYQYFPRAAVRMDWLEKTDKDRPTTSPVRTACNSTTSIVAGARHARAAWSYEAPRPEMAQVGGRFGFWQDVEVR